MRQKCCDRCELVIGLGCTCPPDGAAPTTRPIASPRQEWRSFPADAILISPRRYAHRPGACAHLSEELVTAPAGAGSRPHAAGLWDRLSTSCPAKATEGNTDRQAIRRCEDCQATVG